MNQFLETAGLASVGGWFRRRGRQMHVQVGTPCGNCGTALQGPWCFNCGQAGEDLHRSVWKLAAEAFEGLFHTDGRLWSTLPNLLLKPAKLTRDYLDGHRVPQIPPFRMFLVVLLVVFFTGHVSTARNAEEVQVVPISMSQPTTAQQRTQARLAIARAREQLVVRLPPEARKSFDASVAPALRKMKADERADAQRQAAKEAAADRAGEDNDAAPVNPAAIAKAAAQASVSDAVADSDADDESLSAFTGFSNLKISAGHKSALDHWILVRIKAIRDNPKQFGMVMESWAHRIAILTLPVSALLLTALFAFNRRFYVFDHMVFSMHSLSFQLLLLSLIFLLSIAVGGLAWWLTLLMPVHLYRHMRGVYGRGRFMTLLSMFALFIGTCIGFSFLALLWFAVGFNDMGAG